MKLFTLTLTEDECETLGFALKFLGREMARQNEDDPTDTHAGKLCERSADLYEKLDQCPEGDFVGFAKLVEGNDSTKHNEERSSKLSTYATVLLMPPHIRRQIEQGQKEATPAR